MKIYQLQYFYMVNKCGNYKNAANELGVSQPAISNAIQNLEEELGVALFNRNNKTISLTPAGEAAMPIVSNIILNYNDLANQFQSFSQQCSAPIKVACYQCRSLPKIISQQFIEKDIGIKIILEQRSARSIAAAIEQGEYDIAIAPTDVVSTNMDRYPFGKQEFGVFCAKSNELASYNKITPEMLIGRDILCTNFEEEFVKRYFKLLDIDMPITNLCSTEDQRITAIRLGYSHNNSIAILSLDVDESTPLLQSVPLFPPLYLDLCITWSKHKFITPQLKALINILTSLNT